MASAHDASARSADVLVLIGSGQMTPTQTVANIPMGTRVACPSGQKFHVRSVLLWLDNAVAGWQLSASTNQAIPGGTSYGRVLGLSGSGAGTWTLTLPAPIPLMNVTFTKAASTTSTIPNFVTFGVTGFCAVPLVSERTIDVK